MAKVNLTKMSLKDLRQLAKDVEKAIAAAEKSERAKALEAAKAEAKKHGFSLDELVGAKTATSKGKRGGTTAKVAPKYRHPENEAMTWTGRGRQPKWVKEALEAGKTLADFLIEKA